MKETSLAVVQRSETTGIIDHVWLERTVIVIAGPKDIYLFVGVNIESSINELHSNDEIWSYDCGNDVLPLEVANPVGTSLSLVLRNSSCNTPLLKIIALVSNPVERSYFRLSQSQN